MFDIRADGTNNLTSNQITNAYQNGLSRHNFYRNKHHVPDLILDPIISAVAQSYAEKLSTTNEVKTSGNGNYGENVYQFCYTTPPDVEGKLLNDFLYKFYNFFII